MSKSIEQRIKEEKRKLAALLRKQAAGVKFVGRTPKTPEEKLAKAEREMSALLREENLIVENQESYRDSILREAKTMCDEIPKKIAQLQKKLEYWQSMDFETAQKMAQKLAVNPTVPEKQIVRKSHAKTRGKSQTVNSLEHMRENDPGMVKKVGNTWFVTPKTRE